nr:VOC family protein [Micromonospora sp. 4G55]
MPAPWPASTPSCSACRWWRRTPTATTGWCSAARRGDQPRLAFQKALNLRAPAWPDPERPQQFHLDVTVDDIDAAEKAVLALGARRLPGEGDGWRVYADPSGHPFCLCWD